MTLHWWMHWFWITIQFLVILGIPVPSTTEESQDQVLEHLAVKSSKILSNNTEESYHIIKPQRHNFRVAKAIGLYSPSNTAVLLDRQSTMPPSFTDRGSTIETAINAIMDTNFGENNSSISTVNYNNSEVTVTQRTFDKIERNRDLDVKRNSRITWILTANKTNRSRYVQNERVHNGPDHRVSTSDIEDLTVLPLQEENSDLKLFLDRMKSSSFPSHSSLSSSAISVGIRTFNQSDIDVEVDEELAEPQLMVTAASILEAGPSDSTRLSRARSTFPRDYQRDQIQDDNHYSDYNDSSNGKSDEISENGSSAVGIAAITGSCLATVILLSTVASLGFIMYRRKYLNPPQTLNSDKCSNPDSSGYIDDSTIRDNSEEMYSLDNDSFLNSLEAMTIQNYWTDSVKHTKL